VLHEVEQDSHLFWILDVEEKNDFISVSKATAKDAGFTTAAKLSMTRKNELPS